MSTKLTRDTPKCSPRSSTPIVNFDFHNDGELNGADVKKFRSLTMTAAYLAMDRYDIQHTAKQLATEMKTPTNEGMVKTKTPSALLKWGTASGAEIQKAMGA